MNHVSIPVSDHENPESNEDDEKHSSDVDDDDDDDSKLASNKYKDDLEKFQEAMNRIHSKGTRNRLFNWSNKPVILFGSYATKDKRKRLVKLYITPRKIERNGRTERIDNAKRYTKIISATTLPLEKNAVVPGSLVVFDDTFSASPEKVESLLEEIEWLSKIRKIYIIITTNDSVAPEFDKYRPVKVDVNGIPRLEERLIEVNKLKNVNEMMVKAMLSPIISFPKNKDYDNQIKGLDMRIIHKLTAIFESSAIEPKTQTFYFNGRTNHIDGDEQRFLNDISGLMPMIAKYYPEFVVTILDRLRFCEIYYQKKNTGRRFEKLERLSDTPEMYGLSKPELKSEDLPVIPRIELWFRKLRFKEPHVFCVVPLRGICAFEKYCSATTLHRNNGFWNPRSPFTDFVNKRTSLDFFEPEFWDAIITFKWRAYAFSRFFLIWSMNLLYSVLFAVSTNPTFFNNGYPVWSVALHYAVIALGLLFLLIEFRQLFYHRWRYFFDIYNFVDIITYFFPLFISVRIITGRHQDYDIDITAVAIFFLWIHFLQSCRVFPPIGIFANIVLGGAYYIIPFLFIMLLITLGFGHGLWVLLDNNFSDQFANNSSSSNKFDSLASAIKEVYWGWTGDGSAIQTFDTEGGLVDVARAIMVFLLGIYMVNLLIAVLNEGYGNLVQKSKAAYKLQMVQLIAEIEVFFMFPSERKNPKLFPDDIYFEVSRNKIVKWRKELQEETDREDKLGFLNEYYQVYRRDKSNAMKSDSTYDIGDDDDDDDISIDLLEHYDEKHRNFHIWNFEDNNIGDDGIKALINPLKNSPKVTRLRLTGNGIGDSGISSIIEYLKDNHTLQTLELGYNNITSTGTYALFKCLAKRKSLKTLDLGGNKISLSRLSPQYIIDSKIVELNLKENYIGKEGARALATGLKENRYLKKLDLGWNYIKESGIKAIADSLRHNKALEELILAGNEIPEEAASFLAECLMKNKTLTMVDLSDCEIGNDGARAMAKIHETSLKTLNLQSNYIRLKGALRLLKLRNNHPPVVINIKDQAQLVRKEREWKKNFIPKDIVAFLGKDGCTKLDLSGHSITDKKVKFLADILLPKLTTAEPSIISNVIHDKEAHTIADSLIKNSHLQELDISSNKIGVEGAKYIAESLKQNSTLTHLNINSNKIGDEGVKHLVDSLEKNSTLTHLLLRSNGITDTGVKYVAESLMKNRTTCIIILDLGGNDVSYKLKDDLWRQPKISF